MPQLLVAVSDSVFPNLDPAREVLAKVGAELRLAPETTPEAILQVARSADAALVTYAKITADMIRQMTRCRIIARFGIGVDNVDIAAATSAGIVVTRVPDYCIDEVSDHTLALLLALVRKIPFANSRAHAGRWEMAAVAPIHRLRGRVLGLVGFGRIPRMVAPKAQAFGLRVLTCDPYVSEEVTTAAGVGKADFAELLKVSDYISIHTPLLPETHHLFNADVFAQMKPTAYLINTARGPIVDEVALAHALDAAQLAGAALDVLWQEPPSGSLLFGRDNVILTPHTSFYSVESLVELQIKAAEEVVRVLTGQMPRHAVNPEALRSGRETTLICEQ
jgi:D-3-phosphoglycerate dehydrogenase